MRRVVVTGLGLVTPLAHGVEASWERLVAGRSGIGAITRFDSADLASKIAGEVPLGDGSDGTFDAAAVVAPKDRKKMDEFILYGIAAADEALAASGYPLDSEEKRERAGVMIGSGIGGLTEIYRTSLQLEEAGPRRISPFFIPASLINLVSGQVSMKHGLKGPNHAPVTACATGTHAIGDAARMIALGDADMMLAGGAEAAVNRLGVAGFAAARALSTGYNDRPEAASRPFDQGRDGFVIAEGAGVVVLEEMEAARARGAPLLAEVVGYGMSGDAYHLTAPAPDGSGAYRAMRAALKNAGIAPEAIDYVNAHGTSTPAGDVIELGAVRRLFEDSGADVRKVAISSTKSSIGHLLGAAGAVEAIFGILAMRDGVIPPTLNLDNPAEGFEDLDLTPHQAARRPVRMVLSNSFGFGGINASLIFRVPD